MGRKIKVVNLVLDSFGSFLGMEKGCIILRDRKGEVRKYPLVQTEIGEVVLQSGNMVSTGVLSSLGFWSIDVLVTTRAGRPIAVLKNLSDDVHVKITSRLSPPTSDLKLSSPCSILSINHQCNS